MSKKLYHKLILPAADGMYRYALSIIHEPETAQDVVQDCLAKIWKIRHELTGIEKANAWAFRIVRNRCIEMLRRNRYTNLDDDVFNLQSSSLADQKTINDDHMAWLTEVLSTLSNKQREVFHLREVEEMSYQEIAETCGLTEGDVKINIHRARKKIKEAMQKIEAYGVAN